MAKDKFSATWLSHSSISDYLKCPRLYFLRNMYKDPKTGHKITIMQPPLALGQIVHDVVEALSVKPVEERKVDGLVDVFNESWSKVSGKIGGFKTSEEEAQYKEKGLTMIKKIVANPGPLMRKAIKIRQELPYYWLSEEDNIILCGKIDWLEYCEEDDCVYILDFKTGKNDEDPDSLQLPIYYLLVSHCQTRPVKKAFYWYLSRDFEPREILLPDMLEAEKRVTEIAKKIALARKLDHLTCKTTGGCHHCSNLEMIINGKGELVGESNYHQDIYIL